MSVKSSKLKPRKEQAVSEEQKSKISIASIANEAAKHDWYLDTNTQKQIVEPKQMVEHVTSIPISLIKGEIIYR